MSDGIIWNKTFYPAEYALTKLEIFEIDFVASGFATITLMK